jgi:hypothetical protein
MRGYGSDEKGSLMIGGLEGGQAKELSYSIFSKISFEIRMVMDMYQAYLPILRYLFIQMIAIEHPRGVRDEKLFNTAAWHQCRGKK